MPFEPGQVKAADGLALEASAPPWVVPVRAGLVVHAIHFAVSARSFVWPLCEAAVSQGHRVALWCDVGSDPGAFLADAPCDVLDQNPDITLKPWLVAMRWWGWVKALRAHQAVAMVHAHQSRAALIPLCAAWWLGVPHRVYHNHGLPYLGYHGPLRWALMALERLNALFATEVILVSHSNAEAAKADGLFRNRACTVWGAGSAVGIELPWPQEEGPPKDAMRLAREALKLPQEALVWLYVGRPHRRKGFHFLMDLWASQDWGAQGQILLLAGIRPEDLAPWGELPGVRALGYVKDMAQVYDACHAVLLPSHHEGFGYAMLEGAAHGKALLATRVPGLSCAVQDGLTGRLLPVEAMGAWKEAMNHLMQDETAFTKLGQAARKRVRTNFLREHITEAYLSWLRRRPWPEK